LFRSFSSMETALSERSHGIILPGAYRDILTAVSNELRRSGFHDILPHRDVNNWGLVERAPDDIARACIEQVFSSDLVVALLGQSCGAHFECGVALSAGKPLLLIASPS